MIETRATEDPRQHNQVCGTVRPGYLFDGELIRPQEVIIYTNQSDSPSDVGHAPFKYGIWEIEEHSHEGINMYGRDRQDKRNELKEPLCCMKS